ncbi:tryptophan-rich sensory protein [Spongisporangium articulatum]|uniref:Tryptophan-rich sensory protein n=1 Tax=Spongisporangium articulatum TaxID=3362603 RepID=A0ABW8AMY1_9ACTN
MTTAAVPHPTRPSNGDLARQVAVGLGAVVAIVVAFIGSGVVVGTPIADAAGGALSADATPVAPGTSAFRIWSVIYTGLLALAVFQALPARRTDPRQRSVGLLVLASLVLNAVWILCTQAGWVAATVPVIVALLAVLVVTWARLVRSAPTSWVEAVLVDGTIGLYLGWVSIATVANVAAFGVDAGASATGPVATGAAVTVLVVAAGIGVFLAVVGRGRLAPGAALTWGLAWIAVGRTDGGLENGTVAVVAALAAAVVAATTATARFRAGRATRVGTV